MTTFADQIISVTDLRTKTKESLAGLKKGPKYIFSNNRPVAVIMNLSDYEDLSKPELIELPMSEVTPERLKAGIEAINTPKDELFNI